MNDLTIPRRRGSGLAVITDTIAQHASTFAVAHQCAEWKAALPQVRDVESARIVRATLLPNFQLIEAARRALADMTSREPKADRSANRSRLSCSSSLYNAPGKQIAMRTTPPALLEADAEMFSESDASLAKIINVEPLPRHPVVLALGVRS